MRVCRIIFTDGRWDYLKQTVESFHQFMSPVDLTIVNDDSQIEGYDRWIETLFPDENLEILSHPWKLGLCKSIQTAWKSIPSGFDYIQHLEDDFVLDSHIDLYEMAYVLENNPHLSQLWLMRRPWYQAEIECGGIYKHLGSWRFKPCSIAKTDKTELYWTELTVPFWTCNPSLYPVSIIKNQYPDPPDCEQQFHLYTYHVLNKRSAFWGKPDDPPVVTHIGVISNKTGY